MIRTEQHDSDYIWYLYSPYDIFQYMDISKISEHDLVYENQLRYDTKQNSLRLFNQDIRLVIQYFKTNQRSIKFVEIISCILIRDTDKDAFLPTSLSIQVQYRIWELLNDMHLRFHPI